MGYRDDNIVNEERSDAALRRALERIQALEQIEPPPDIVAQTARRLPDGPPALAARQLARRTTLRLAVGLGLIAALVLIAVLGFAGAIAGGARLALLFGDGGAGVSRALLTVQLLAKPLWHSVGSGGGLVLIGGALALAGAGWLWWATLRRTPIYVTENAP